jgi:hypothetical protein
MIKQTTLLWKNNPQRLSEEKIALSTSGLYSLPTCHQPINPAISVSLAWLY